MRLDVPTPVSNLIDIQTLQGTWGLHPEYFPRTAFRSDHFERLDTMK